MTVVNIHWITKLSRWHRISAVFLLGFASGLPLALTGGALQAWLTIEGLDLTSIGFLGLVALPYTFKFLWAPLLDRFEPPLLGRRRGWIFLLQLIIAALLFSISAVSPSKNIFQFGIFALLIAFCSASLDIVVDAYRTDLLEQNERGLGSSLSVLGYRIAMIVSGGIAMIWAQQWNSWAQVYEVLSITLVVSAFILLLFLPQLAVEKKALASDPRSEIFGFIALIFGILLGHLAIRFLMGNLGIDLNSKNDWIRVSVLMCDVLPSIGLGLWLSRRIGFATLNASLESFFSSKHAWTFLLLMFLYKVGDAFTVSLTTPFMIRGLGFEQIDVGLANKTVGLLAIILGAMVGGVVMLRLKLWTALFWFAVLQLLSIIGYYFLAVLGKGAWGSVELPAFNIFIAKLAQPTQIDCIMVSVVGFENFASGMGTAAHLALMMSLCHKQFSATHFALLSAFATIGRVFVAPFSGVIANQFGWPSYYLIAILVATPGVLLVWRMRKPIEQLA